MVESGTGRSLLGVGKGLWTEYLNGGSAATAAKMLPGIAVMYDGNQYSVKESSGVTVIGTIGYESAMPNVKPTDRDTAYAAGANIPIESGPRIARMWLADSQTITKGDNLTVTTDGYLAESVINGVVSVSEAGSATKSTGNDVVYAIADENKTTSGAVAAIWVKTLR